ncbi:MAG: L-fucose/L-arabinose isomerase family protein [Bryobacterales bacterium]|nr:L-fucose/L-arabinose isomerase family protein [Bryobacteraceae bacterium]MDW8129794.1 L-fucose/L-arabinose isomerase family protein [Bryobacterales bacterium]
MGTSEKGHRQARVGVFGVGLAAYWPQFPGLKERLEGYLGEVERRIAGFGAEIVRGGMVDNAVAARKAGEMFARAGVDLLVCHTATYATSSQVLPVVQQARVPVVVLNLQPVAALDYERTDTAEWLANCSACCVPEISNAFARSGVEFHVVSGMLFDDEQAWGQIGQWCRAAAAAGALRRARLGFLGHTYPGMLDMYSDFTMVHGQLGAHVEVLEMCDLARLAERVAEEEIERKLAETVRLFEIAQGVEEEDLRWAARVAVGLDRLVEEFALDGLTYYYRGLDGNLYERLGAGMILGNSLLTARGIPASGEGDLKNCIAMLLMDRLGAGGSYTEFYAMDFRENFLLMGHDGPGHIAISDRRPVLRSLGLYHGKRGYGVSVEFNVKTGPVTILGLTQTGEGRLKLVAAEGESLPGPILRIGNTNSRIRFRLPPAEFVNRWCREGPTHHCALGIGHRMGEIEKVAALLGLPLARVGVVP